MRIGVVCGLGFEAEIVTRRARYEGLADRILVSAGLGRERARTAAEKLLADNALALLSFGLAAGLDPSLTSGTTILASSIRAQALPSIECTPDWGERLSTAFPSARRGILAHAPQIVALGAEKRKLRAATQGLAADMESYGVAEAAAAANIPFAALRVVADRADENLPEIALHAMAPDGSLRLAEVLGRIARSPGQVPSLIKLALSTARARQRLEEIARAGTKETFFSAAR
ncbi:MAG: hypothetical protein AB7E79_13525 [Rhodospirillaceae bacterium]